MFGFSSPWDADLNSSGLQKLRSYFIYTVALSAYYWGYLEVSNYKSNIIVRLYQYLMVVYTIEIFLYIYMHNVRSKTFTPFLRRFQENEAYLRNALNLNSQTGSSVTTCKELLIFLSCLFTFLFNITILFYSISGFTLLMSLRRLLAFIIMLQWSLCLHHVDVQISKLSHLIKTSLEATDSSNAVAASNSRDVPAKRINMETFENVIEIYRMLAAKRNCVNKYYAVNIGFNICIALYITVQLSYICWIRFSMGKDVIQSYFELVKIAVDFLNIAIIATVCDFANKKVRTLRFYSYKIKVIYDIKTNYLYIYIIYYLDKLREV